MTSIAKIDFWKDVQEYYQNELVSVNVNSSLENSVYKFLLYSERRIISKPRKILKSKELVVPVEVEIGLGIFESAVLAGKDVNPYQSKGLLRLDEDDMYNDWNIRHFHLGEKIDPRSQMIERTEYVLMAVVTDYSIHFIQIEDHNAWTKARLLDIVNQNWKELLMTNLLSGVTLSHNYSDDDRKKLRKNNLVSFVTLATGEVLAPPNLGNTTAGTSLKIQTQEDRLHRHVKNIEKNFNNNIQKVAEDFKNQLDQSIIEFEFHLDVSSLNNQDKAIVYEKNINGTVDIFF